MKKKYSILGIEYGGHDTSAALLVDGRVISCCEQERFDLEKHSRAFPSDAINECLKIGGLSIDDIDEISIGFDFVDMIKKVYLKPAIKDISRLNFMIKDIKRIESYLQIEKLVREKTSFKKKINFFRHHLCHLASSYYPSGFKNALLVSYDGMGEIETGMIAKGVDGDIEILQDKVYYPNSLGLIYSAITYFLGWKHHCDEGIIMGLAPFGDYNSLIPGQKKTYLEVFKEIIIPKGEKDYEINLDYIDYHKKRDVWVSKKFKKIFGNVRNYSDPLKLHHKNIAAALQKTIEDIVLSQLSYFRKKTNLKKLCISGGVGLNCSLNGKISESNLFDEIFVQPASGDAGISFGSTLLAEKKRLKKFKPKKNHNFYIGSRFSDTDIENTLKKNEILYEKPPNLTKEVAKYLLDGKIISWFQGAAEFGPRALGNRSILSRPFPESQRDFINKRVKFREEFRPFAPAVLDEYKKNYFIIDQESPHMLIACKVKPNKKSEIPAVVHIDDTCRVQTVKKINNELFYNLLKAFHKISGCPVLLNTSFNVKGQPIVNTPQQAIDCFISTKIDVLVIGSYIIKK
tara:strand:- start:1698 stop:3413 length:1716 start_codon:yes stop_codon:yes gene_type:complete